MPRRLRQPDAGVDELVAVEPQAIGELLAGDRQRLAGRGCPGQDFGAPGWDRRQQVKNAWLGRQTRRYRESTIWLTAGDLKWDARYRLRLGCIAARQVLLQIAPCAEEARLPAASSRRPPAGAIAAARG